jgi:hypothetical protein
MTSRAKSRLRARGITVVGLLLSGGLVILAAQRVTSPPEWRAVGSSLPAAVAKTESAGRVTRQMVDNRAGRSAETREQLAALSDDQRSVLAPSFQALDWMERLASETHNDVLAARVEQERARGVRAAAGLPRHWTSKER